jgi:hypothetical protein
MVERVWIFDQIDGRLLDKQNSVVYFVKCVERTPPGTRIDDWARNHAHAWEFGLRPNGGADSQHHDPVGQQTRCAASRNAGG